MAENKVEVVLTARNDAGTAFREATRDVAELGRQFTSAQGLIAGAAGLIGGAVATLGLEAVAAAKRLATVPLEAIKASMEMVEFADRVGLSATELSKWSVIAETTGVSAQTIATAMRQLSRSMAEAGDTRTLDEGLLSSIQYLQGIGDEATRNAEAIRIFGRAGMDMGGLFRMSAQELANWIEFAKQSGAVMSETLVVRAKQADYAVAALKVTWQGLKNAMAEAVMMQPAVVSLMNAMAENVPAASVVNGSPLTPGWAGPIPANAQTVTLPMPQLPTVNVYGGSGIVPTAQASPLYPTPYGVSDMAPVTGVDRVMIAGGWRRFLGASGGPDIDNAAMAGASNIPSNDLQWSMASSAMGSDATAKTGGDEFGKGLAEATTVITTFSDSVGRATTPLERFTGSLIQSAGSLLSELGAKAGGLPGQFMSFAGKGLSLIGTFGFANEGVVPMVSGASYGRDSVPAMLTPGEAVVRPGSAFARQMAGGGGSVVNVTVHGSNTYQDRTRLAYDIREAQRAASYSGWRTAA